MTFFDVLAFILLGFVVWFLVGFLVFIVSIGEYWIGPQIRRSWIRWVWKWFTHKERCLCERCKKRYVKKRQQEVLAKAETRLWYRFEDQVNAEMRELDKML